MSAKVGWIIPILFLTACATPAPPAPTIKVCPAIVTYSSAEQLKAQAELKPLPDGDIIGQMITDYLNLRDRIRACKASN